MLRVLTNRWFSTSKDEDSDRNDSVNDTKRKSSKPSNNDTLTDVATTAGASVLEQSRGSLRRQSSGANPSQAESPEHADMTRSSSKSGMSIGDENLDYDALYEPNSDDDELIRSNGSVISHLISQIKIGMDLTKVVLPTFILERRSLLEMYADFFAHPDIFLRITDLDNPRDRIMQVVKWYLTSYHAGRRGSVAKKPYNPILGEVFKCHWDVPDNNTSSGKTKTHGASSSDDQKPIPWATDEQLVFVAEQVSHHPPISAFYAEHVNKQVSFCAHIYTKSKFLGMSVCVCNIGQGVLTLHARNNEQYIVTFPNGYGRSILTVPWVELGGSVKITCTQTGYYADIEFLMKPFYSNKKNRITCDVYAPGDKQPFVKLNGEWNGAIEAKWTQSGATEEFVDINKLTIINKSVRSVMKQEENESRRLWRDVTHGLAINNIDKATNAKYALEQKQRNEAKTRKDDNSEWEPKLFELHGQQWFYKNPLTRRMNA